MSARVFWSRVTINLPLCWQPGIALMTLSGCTRGGWRDKLTWYYITSLLLYMGAMLETTLIFRVKSSNFLCPLSSLRFCLIWSAALVFLADFQNSPPVLNTHHYSSILSLVCVCVFLRESSQQKDGEGFKVTERTGGQSGLCQQWRIVMFDDENKVKQKHEGGIKREREGGSEWVKGGREGIK